MPTTHAEVLKEIQSLEREVVALRAKDAPGVIQKIRAAMEAYALTIDDLGFGSPLQRPKLEGRGDAPRYKDGKGNAWIGRGPRPAWLKAALTAGAKLEDFDAGAKLKSQATPTGKKSPGLSGTEPRRWRYRDPLSGKTWTGQGRKPAWIVAGLAQGKKLSDFTR